MAANLVLGQSNFTSSQPGATSASLNGVNKIAIDSSGNVWLSDYANSRVLRFSPPFSNGMSANLVIGQPDFSSHSCNQFCDNGGIAIDPAGNLWVANGGHVLEFIPPFSNGMAASTVIGQSPVGVASQNTLNGNLSNNSSIAADSSGAIFVTDVANNRVLKFSPPFSSGMNASMVLGQPDFFSVGGCNVSIDFSSAQSLCQPTGLAFDASGNLWVADSLDFRVVKFSAPLSSNMAASLELGQPNLQDNSLAGPANLSAPSGIVIDSTTGRVFVTDVNNERILWWNNAATLVNRQPADGVLGAPDLNIIISSFTGANSYAPTTNTQKPAADGGGHLWVPDNTDNRVLRFSPPFSSGMNADLVLGQPDFASNGAGLDAASLSQPYAAAVDGGNNVWVADTVNDRVVRFSPPFASGMAANLVLGAPNLTTAGGGPASATMMGQPQGLSFDVSGNLWISDTPNNRVLRFSPPFSNGMAANLVLGQATFSSSINGSAMNQMTSPVDVSIDAAGHVWVMDYGNNRALRFSTPFTNGMNADLALGQPHTQFLAKANQLNGPSAMFADPTGNVWIADSSDNRVLKFNANDTTPPNAVTSLQISNIGLSSVTLSWTAPGDPDSSVSSYNVRYASFALTAATFASATAVAGVPAPAAPGTPQSVVVTGLLGQTTFFAALTSQVVLDFQV